MPQINVRIQSLQDASDGVALIEGMSPENAVESQRLTVAIQEGGTVGGQTSLMFILEFPGPEYRYVQMTAALFEGLAAAYLGAQLRFGQPYPIAWAAWVPNEALLKDPKAPQR